jgi:hypothetical protein
MKEAVYGWLQDRDDLPPTEEEIDLVLERSMDMKDERHSDIMIWYWDELLPAAVVEKGCWKQNTRYFNIISVSKREIGNGLRFITPATEAFALAVYVNYFSGWHEMYKLRKQLEKDHPKNKLKFQPRKKKSPSDPDYVVDLGRQTCYLQSPKYEAKWTKSDRGNSVAGGWSQTGMLVYKRFYDQLEAKREDAQRIEAEKIILAELRQIMNITADSWEDMTPKKGGKKKKNKTEDDGFIASDTFYGFNPDGYGSDGNGKKSVHDDDDYEEDDHLEDEQDDHLEDEHSDDDDHERDNDDGST